MPEIIDKIKASKYRTTREKVYLTIVILISLGLWFWVSYSLLDQLIQDTFIKKAEESIDDGVFGAFTSPVVLLFFFSFGLLSHFLAMAYVRINGVRIGPNQFPEIWESVERYSKVLGMKQPPSTFIMNGNGILNAFAAKLIFREMMVLYSDLVVTLLESRDQRQLDSVIAHELGHHALDHTGFWQWFLVPGELLPFIGTALSRAREYSADRIMKVCIKEDKPCEKALATLAAGRGLGNKVNVDAYLDQAGEELGFFAWLSEKLSTHPYLPKRIWAIRNFNP